MEMNANVRRYRLRWSTIWTTSMAGARATAAGASANTAGTSATVTGVFETAIRACPTASRPVTMAVDRTAVTTPYSMGLTTFALPKKNLENFF